MVMINVSALNTLVFVISVLSQRLVYFFDMLLRVNMVESSNINNNILQLHGIYGPSDLTCECRITL